MPLSTPFCGGLRERSSGARPGTEKLLEDGNESIRALDVGHVAAVGDEGQGAFRQAGHGVSRLGGRKHSIPRSPDYERWHLEARKPIQQYLALAP